jgi:UDP-N-acetylmuramoyl-L-alanyl-D-glutamate--2,6-diaminopimelate ligase
MGAIVNECADFAILTSDNPRSERPAAIMDEVLAGMPDRAHVLVEEDRAKAIHAAIEMAHEGDTVLLAGKGHETYQVMGTQRLPFSDLRVATEAIEAQTTRKQNRSDAVER